jgi:predicted ATP-grasp superfamily ATP-dependent carboligase
MVQTGVNEDGTITLDFTPRQIVGDERDSVVRSLEQLPGYVLVDNYVPANPWIVNVPIRDFSPPVDVLIDHYARIAEGIMTVATDLAQQQSTIDAGSNLGIYLVRISEQPENMEPIPIIVSLRDERVVGFN